MDVSSDVAKRTTQLHTTVDEDQKLQSSGTSDGTPLVDDDQQDELINSVAQEIYRWVRYQNPRVEELTRRQRFDDVRLKGLALSMNPKSLC